MTALLNKITVIVLVYSFPMSYAAAATTGAGPLGGLVSKLEQFNSYLIALGGTLAVAGFVWALMGIIFGLRGLASAVTVLLAGLAISAAPQIVALFTV